MRVAVAQDKAEGVQLRTMRSFGVKSTQSRKAFLQPCSLDRAGTLAVVIIAALSVSVLSCTPTRGSANSPSAIPVTIISTPAPEPTVPEIPLEPSATPPRPGFHLVFADEFIGPQLNTRLWTSDMPWGSTTLKEDQRYSPDAVAQGRGVLTITATPQPKADRPYRSGVITTEKSLALKYGYAESRIQIPAGAGLWSAFWLTTTVPQDHSEIDIVEVLGQEPRQAYQVLHYGFGAKKGKALHVSTEPELSAGFHTFAVDWEPEYLIWYVDGVERFRVTENIPSVPMVLIVNLAVGGKDAWSGPPSRDTEFPAELKVDYVRVYQRD